MKTEYITFRLDKKTFGKIEWLRKIRNENRSKFITNMINHYIKNLYNQSDNGVEKRID